LSTRDRLLGIGIPITNPLCALHNSVMKVFFICSFHVKLLVAFGICVINGLEVQIVHHNLARKHFLSFHLGRATRKGKWVSNTIL